HDLLYVPYCDGSLFAGDVDQDLPPSLVDPSTSGFSFQRGLQNLSAALDVGGRQFPAPRRIVLAGASGGAFGTISAAPLVRRVYPDAEILVLNDSGLGIARDGEPDFIEGLLEGWNALDAIPASCPECTAGGHIVELVAWNLSVDPNLRVAPITHTRDAVIAGVFLMERDLARFEAAILRETGAIAARFPERYRRFLQPGENHSVLLNAVPPVPFSFLGMLGGLEEEIDGVSALAWITAAVAGSDAWRDTVDPSLR
ncbi:MAG: hypothetical protein AAGH15_25730, partial [Myxococcota bacterium]